MWCVCAVLGSEAHKCGDVCAHVFVHEEKKTSVQGMESGGWRPCMATTWHHVGPTSRIACTHLNLCEILDLRVTSRSTCTTTKVYVCVTTCGSKLDNIEIFNRD